MRPVVVAAAVVVLGVASWAGVAFAGCGGPSGASLVWLNPTGTGSPSSHTAIVCSETGRNTNQLGLTAGRLGPGDACRFGASLHNTGDEWLRISEVTRETTPHGAPPFASCFGFSLSSGPPSGKIAGGGSYGYTFTFSLLSSAGGACLSGSGTVSIVFTGTPP